MAVEDDATRLENELALLTSMYPDDLTYNAERRELYYRPNGQKAVLCLRIPSDYPSMSKPETVGGVVGLHDVRDRVRYILSPLEVGEESLDAVVAGFNDLAEEVVSQTQHNSEQDETSQRGEHSGQAKTVIIWLHHLLATAKRKAILSPPSPDIAGISKPGYPGVLVFSGPANAVDAHARELRGMNWQAFQVRAEEADLWEFKHGQGVMEFESMGEVVADLPEGRSDLFMEAMRMK